MHILAPVLDCSTFASIGYNRNRCSSFALLLALFDAEISAHFPDEISSFFRCYDYDGINASLVSVISSDIYRSLCACVRVFVFCFVSF